jgi:hypothetical protein
MDLAINERVSDMGKLTAYLVVQTPQGAWLSFAWNRGGFVITEGLKPAASSTVIPLLHMPILDRKITASLTRGDYWFAAAIFHTGDRITLANWRDLAIHSSEATVTAR